MNDMPEAKRYEIIEEMKPLLNTMKQKEHHEKELENYPPEKQKEIYNFLVQELESIFSFQIIMSQLKNDKDTIFGSIHS